VLSASVTTRRRHNVRRYFAGPGQTGGITLVEAVICLAAVAVFIGAVKWMGFHPDETVTFLGAAIMLAGMIATRR
jgi:hypothetical protein